MYSSADNSGLIAMHSPIGSLRSHQPSRDQPAPVRRRPRSRVHPAIVALASCLLVATLPAVLAAPATPRTRDTNKLPPCASSYALWNRDIPAEFDLGFLSVKSGFECAGHVVAGSYARVAVYKKSEGRCYMKGVPRSSQGTLHGHRGEVLGTHRIPGHVVTSATFTNRLAGADTQSRLGNAQAADPLEPPYNWAHVFDSAAADADTNRAFTGMATCDLVFRQGDRYECQRFEECSDCVMYVGWNCAAEEEDEAVQESDSGETGESAAGSDAEGKKEEE